MDLPALVADRLDGESVLATVELGGGDAVVVTPARTLVYRSEGLLSDEAVSEYPLDVDRLTVSEGRKATFGFEYLDGSRSFRVGGGKADDVLEALLAGILRAEGVVDADETLRQAYRFSELTLVVTDARVVKHVGEAAWAEEFEDYPFADLTGMDTEEGNVATQLVLEIDGRPNRIKTPADEARAVRETVERAVFEYHGVSSLAELEAALAPENGGDEHDENTATTEPDAAGFEPLVDDDGDARDAERSTGVATDGEVAEELADLRAEVERQADVLERQQETIEQLIEELQRGR